MASMSEHQILSERRPALEPAAAVCEPKDLPIPAPIEDEDVCGNRWYWSHYDWPEWGEEWSRPFGGTAGLWFSILYPRLWRRLPAAHALEIGPGFGRISNYLRRMCDRLTLVDLTPRCIEACRRRFAADAHIQYHVNNGVSLGAVGDACVDLAFSFDALPTVRQNVVDAYIRELARVLRPGGWAFIHHGNLGAYASRLTGDEPAEVTGGRRKDQTAARFREVCAESGLWCISQELIPWTGPGMFTDALSLITRPGRGGGGAETQIVERADWGDEVSRAAILAGAYGASRSVTRPD